MHSTLVALIASAIGIVLMPFRLVKFTDVLVEPVVTDNGWTETELAEYQLEVERMIGEGGA